MKKIFLLLLLLFVGIDCFSQSINVFTKKFTTEQLVKDVLVNRNCVIIDNIKSKTGLDFGSSNGIGYFTNTNPNFPLSSGVILSTGNVENAVGPNTSKLNDGSDSWDGDRDLEAVLQEAKIELVSKNASVLEFDFIPLSNNFDFNFVFASEEYGQDQCKFSDAFAFLLTNLSTGFTTNLAVVPNTKDPISVVTIRKSDFNNTCNDQNPSFFGEINLESMDSNSPTNFNGQTILMNANTQDLVPNTKYRIKLVIADRKDFQSDSAIFIEANSFNVGQDVLGHDLTIKDNTAVCFGETKKLESGLDPTLFSFEWTFNGNRIGGNSPDIIADKSGIYGLTYYIKSSNCLVTTDFLKVEYFSPIITPNPVDLVLCDSALQNLEYNLAINTTRVQVAETKVSYHATEPEAQENMNPLATTYKTSKSNLPITIWMRIVNTTTNCFTTKSFVLKTTPAPVANKPINLRQCETNIGGNTARFGIFSQSATILNGQSNTLNLVTYYKTQSDAITGTNEIKPPTAYISSGETIFAKVQNSTDPNCFDITSFDLVVNKRPVLDNVADLYVCNDYVLPKLVNPGTYYSGPNKELPILPEEYVVKENKTIYIFYENGNSSCFAEERKFDITFIENSDLQLNVQKFCDQAVLPQFLSGIRYFKLPGGPTVVDNEEIIGGSVITNSQTLYTYFESTVDGTTCTLQGDIQIEITETPKVVEAPFENKFACGTYSLPPLVLAKYYTLDTSSGTYIPIVSDITTTTTVYVFAEEGNCKSQIDSFTVYIETIKTADITACRFYDLPPAPVGEYRDAPDGGGKTIPPGRILETTTIYPYIPGAFCKLDPFEIKINAPFLTPPIDFKHCDPYLLPPNLDGAKYYKLSGGPTTPDNKEFKPNDVITSTQTIHLFKPGTVAGCDAEYPWTITINSKPKLDPRPPLTVCNRYKLPPLKIGNYFQDKNGVNPIKAGEILYEKTKLYIYATNPTDKSCFEEDIFEIDFFYVEADPAPSQLNHCVSFTFPPLPSPNNFYYDAPEGPNGGGKLIPIGTTVTASDLKPEYYVYTDNFNSVRSFCYDENPFKITLKPNPVANPVAPLVKCDDFKLNDGFYEFNLEDPAIRNQIINGQAFGSELVLTFYKSEADAKDILAVPIANPSKYQNKIPFDDSVWIRLNNSTVPSGCFDVTELKLKVNPYPEPVLDAIYYLCEDHETKSVKNPITLDTGLDSSIYDFQWTYNGVVFPQTTKSIIIENEGDYLVTATNKLTLCDKSVSTKVIKYNPYLELEYSDAFVVPTFVSLKVLGDSTGNFEYKVDNFPYQNSTVFSNVFAGEHTFFARDKDGHCDPKPIKITLVNFPKFFTPNGDGFNDTWNIPHLKETNPFVPINIFDRYGKLLKQITPSGEGWNGTLGGNPLPSSDYWFSVHFKEKGEIKVFKSHFTLKR